MFERCTESGRQVVVFAQSEARALGHDYLGTEHLLLGVLREGGAGAQALHSLGLELPKAQAEVAREIGRGTGTQAQIPFTPRAKRALELSLQEAEALGQRRIGTEHILLALAQLKDGLATQVLRTLGTDPESVRGAVLDPPD